MSEADPNGIDQHSPGSKLDKGKRLSYTVLSGFAPGLQSVVDVGTYGANKYTKHGWKHVQDGKERYYEALMRHLLEDLKEENSLDPETELTHLAHAAWNILALLTLRVRTQEEIQSLIHIIP